MSEWRVEKEPRLDLYRVTDGKRTWPSSIPLQEAEGWAAYLNNLEQYKALAERAENLVALSQAIALTGQDANYALAGRWLKDYDALRAQEAGQ